MVLVDLVLPITTIEARMGKLKTDQSLFQIRNLKNWENVAIDLSSNHPLHLIILFRPANKVKYYVIYFFQMGSS